jgi:hypothetical protein
MDYNEGSIILPLPTEEVLKKREEYWRVELPDSYKKFIKDRNGVTPVQATVTYDSHNENIERFLCILDSTKDNATAARFEIDVVMASRIERLGYDENSIGVHVLLIAKMDYGNYLALNYKDTESNPTVCVWDNEESGDFDPVVYFVASSFEEFLNTLK